MTSDHGEHTAGLESISMGLASAGTTMSTISAAIRSAFSTFKPQPLPIIPPSIGSEFRLAWKNWNQNDLPKIQMAFLSLRLQIGLSQPTSSLGMIMDEATFYRNMVKPRFDDWGTHDRIENAVGSGLPDISYAIGRQGWLETKVVHSGKIFFENFQLPWFKKRLRHMGGKDLWVLALDKDGVKLYAAADLLDAPREKIRKWTVIKTADLAPTLVIKHPWDWQPLRQALLYEFTPQDPQLTTQSQSGE